ncbi:MAG TPA: Uma2 family endonuclease [Gemmatirosa sp.]
MATLQRRQAREGPAEHVPERVWTADEVRDLIDERRPWPRFECARGRLLVTPSPRDLHQTVVSRLVTALTNYCDAHFEPGVALVAPADISWGHRDTTLQPDVFVVPRAMLRAGAALASSTAGWAEIRQLLLAAEVLSPGSETYDRGDKRAIYQAEGTPFYWVVDRAAGLVEEWTPAATAPRVERERLVWHPDGAVVPFVLELAHLFRPI